MERQNQILVYGSYGYTGKLIVDELKKRGLPILLSGRNKEKLAAQSNHTGFSFRVIDINDESELRKTLRQSKVVIHCAGPFQYTSETMIKACLAVGTHYMDITGEFRVFEMLRAYDTLAKEANITVMPGTGFDVVPSDCLAAYLKSRVHDATHLELAFTSMNGGFSRGTMRTGIESLGEGIYIRQNRRIINMDAGSLTRVVNFGIKTMKATAIPWGDIATAYHSTGIPNIIVYMGVSEKMLSMIRRSNWISWLLKQQWVKQWLKKKVDAKGEGPSPEKRSGGKSLLWGKVKNENGNEFEALLETMDGYSLTAFASASIAEKIFNGNFIPGYQTPSMAYGADLILEVPASKRTDV